MTIPRRGGFGAWAEQASEPSSVYAPVTPSASDLALGSCRAILAGVAGNVNLIDLEGNTRVDFPLQAGYNPIAAKRISAPTSGTAATSIWALY